MLSMLINEYPELMGIIKEQLKKYVALAEMRYNYRPGDMWYRFFRPNDPGIGGTNKVYTATMSNGAEEHLLAQATAITVPVANAYVSFGWYITAEMGDGGYLLVKKQGVTKQELLARVVYERKSPKHLYLDFDAIIAGFQQEQLDFVIYNAFGADQICVAIPFMFRIATKSALNLD